MSSSFNPLLTHTLCGFDQIIWGNVLKLLFILTFPTSDISLVNLFFAPAALCRAVFRSAQGVLQVLTNNSINQVIIHC